MHPRALGGLMRKVLLLLALVPALLLVAPAADARPGWWCGNWGYGGHSSVDAACTDRDTGYSCLVWTLDGTCWQMW